MNIPQKIHYFWYGSSIPSCVSANIDNWKRLNPSYDFHAWTDPSEVVDLYPFAKQAYDDRKWGFLSDSIRFHALMTEGGVYLDSDVELVRPLDFFSALGNRLVMGYMYDCAIGTATIASPKGHPIIQDLMSLYDRLRPGFYPVSNAMVTAYFLNKIPEFLLTGKRWESSNCYLFPKEYFEHPAFIRTKGAAIHHYFGTWMGKSIADVHGSSNLSHFGKWAKRKIRTYWSTRHNEFTPFWRAALKGRKVQYDWSEWFQ